MRAIAKAILIQLTAYSLDLKLVPTARLALHYTIVYYVITLVLASRTHASARNKGEPDVSRVIATSSIVGKDYVYNMCS